MGLASFCWLTEVFQGRKKRKKKKKRYITRKGEKKDYQLQQHPRMAAHLAK